MRRIGIFASRISRGNPFKYNVLVVAIACLISLFVFLVCGFAVVAALFLLSFILRPFVPMDFPHWVHLIKLSLMSLAVLICFLNVIAIVKNIKAGRTSDE